jgi:hypothetical protein
MESVRSRSEGEVASTAPPSLLVAFLVEGELLGLRIEVVNLDRLCDHLVAEPENIQALPDWLTFAVPG